MRVRTNLRAGLVAAAAGAAAIGGRAAPPNYFPLRQHQCALDGTSCAQLPATWSENGPNGKMGGTNAIESIDLDYTYAFKAGVYVIASPAGQPKQCQMSFAQHIDLSTGHNLGFYKSLQAKLVETAPPASTNDDVPLLDFSGSVVAHVVDPQARQDWYGTGEIGLASGIDLYPSQSSDKLSCLWKWVASKSVSGTVKINYRHVVLYGAVLNPGKRPTLPKRRRPLPLAK